MTIVNNQVKNGVLTLGAVAFACQATNVTITPSFDDSGDAVTTLCGDSLEPSTTTSWTISITAVQDFNNPDGFIAYAFLNNLETVTFSWTPNGDSGAIVVTGSVQVRAVEFGGDVATNLDTTAEWNIIGDPVVAAWAPGDDS